MAPLQIEAKNMTLRVVAWNSATQRLVRTNKDPADIGGAVLIDVVDAGSVTVPLGSTSATIPFNMTFDSAGSYALVVNMTNLVDTSAQYQPVIVISKTTTEFTALWNVPTDSANYRIDFIAVIPFLSFRANVEALSSGIKSNTSALLSAATYATIPQIINEVDTTPIILHPVNITVKDSISFTTKWNINTDTSNYNLHWAATLTTGSTLKSGINIISNGATSISISFGFPALATGSYALIPRMSNVTDTNSLYQPITVTSKTISGFTAKWNQPVDSVNYKLDWILKTL